MLHRIPRSVRWALLVAVLGAVTVSVVQSWSSGAPGTGGWTQTQWGPLGPADRDLLVKVRQAGLWEIPTGQQMAQQATNQQVRETGQHLAEQHTVLDQIDRDVADKLGVQLPSRASDQQNAWMNQISAGTGTDYDKAAVQLLRHAHGIVLPVVANARVGTRNELIRQFADTTFQYVTGHIAMLEATGLVDYSALPEAPSPGFLSGATGPADVIVPAIVFLAAAGAAIGLLVTLRRGRRRPAPAGAATTGSQVAALHTPPVVTVPVAALPPGGSGGRRRRGDTGGIPAVEVTGGHRRTSDPGRVRAATRSTTDSGRNRVPEEYRATTESGRYRVPEQYRATTDSGRYRVPAEPGRRRPGAGVRDTGGHRARTATAVSDSGGFEAVPRRRRSPDTGGFRFDDLLDDRAPDRQDAGGRRARRR